MQEFNNWVSRRSLIIPNCSKIWDTQPEWRTYSSSTTQMYIVHVIRGLSSTSVVKVFINNPGKLPHALSTFRFHVYFGHCQLPSRPPGMKDTRRSSKTNQMSLDFHSPYLPPTLSSSSREPAALALPQLECTWSALSMKHSFDACDMTRQNELSAGAGVGVGLGAGCEWCANWILLYMGVRDVAFTMEMDESRDGSASSITRADNDGWCLHPNRQQR